MRGAYPEGFPDWEVAEIEKFRDSNPSLYEWRKTAHLIPVNMNRPIGRAIPVPRPSPAKAGARLRDADGPGLASDKDDLRDWAPPYAGEGKSDA